MGCVPRSDVTYFPLYEKINTPKTVRCQKADLRALRPEKANSVGTGTSNTRPLYVELAPPGSHALWSFAPRASTLNPYLQVCFRDLTIGIYGPAAPTTLARMVTRCFHTALVRSYSDFVIRYTQSDVTEVKNTSFRRGIWDFVCPVA